MRELPAFQYFKSEAPGLSVVNRMSSHIFEHLKRELPYCRDVLIVIAKLTFETPYGDLTMREENSE